MDRTHGTVVVLTVVVCLAGHGAPAAQLVTVNDWTYRDDVVDVDIPVFQVMMTFTSASGPGGTENKYEYSVENLTNDLTAVIFRVANPDDVSRAMSGPAGWGERVGAQYFVRDGGSIPPGQMLAGFQV